MTRPTKVHCFFEQSGTFKNEFRKLGIPAEDYDIQNNFGETDHVIDLFAEIERGYDGKPSVFDTIGGGDLIMAFFPCIYFCEANQRLFRFEDRIYEKMTHKEAVDYMIDRSKKRQLFFEVALKMFCLCDIRRKMLIVENPYRSNHFLCQYFPYRCSVIDTDRSMRGDFFHKPTQFWFINCKPTRCYSLEKNRNTKSAWKLKKAPSAGLCSEERSMISPDYARNFIADFILGRPLGGRPQQQDLFAQTEGEKPCS